MDILGSIIFAIIFSTIFTMLLYSYWTILRVLKLKIRIILFVLRLFSIIFFIFLLIDPYYKIIDVNNRSQKINIILDKSLSMDYHFNNNKIDISNILSKINRWGEVNNLKLNRYSLGNGIAESIDFKHYYNSTDFSYLEQNINLEEPDQIILITDGQATQGKEIDQLKINKTLVLNFKSIKTIKLKNI